MGVVRGVPPLRKELVTIDLKKVGVGSVVMGVGQVGKNLLGREKSKKQ